MEVNNQLSAKYSGKVLMYTEYPSPRTWSQNFGNEEYVAAWRDLLEQDPQAPIMLYVHMPYCVKQCLFCTCTVLISQDYADIRNYMAVLAKEIALLRKLFDSLGAKPNFREIHLGGGSPTYIRPQEFETLMANLGTILDFENLSEFSIEIDPRHVKEDGMRYYANKGINRVSFGIQDFDLDIQRSVDRIQPAHLTKRLLTPEIRSLFPHGVNFDIICGLPHQTIHSIRSTMKTVVAMAPERICFNYMDMAPKYNPHQLLMPIYAIPQHRQRREIFLAALDILNADGYVRTAFDHFAKPQDGVTEALEEGKTVWNRLGVVTGNCTSVVGIGNSSISQIGDAYAQNFYELPPYIQALEAGIMPVFRGTRLSADDRIRKEAINAVRNRFRIDFSDFETQFGIDFPAYFPNEMARLKEFADDGIVAFDASGISVTELGTLFANHAAQTFDAHLG